MTALFCTLALAADGTLRLAVEACVGEEPTGNCTCEGTSCSTDARFQGEIGTWDVSGVANMEELFYDRDEPLQCRPFCEFNGDIATWNTSSVTSMKEMCARRLSAMLPWNRPTLNRRFRGAESFNRDISAWVTSSVTTMYGM